MLSDQIREGNNKSKKAESEFAYFRVLMFNVQGMNAAIVTIQYKSEVDSAQTQALAILNKIVQLTEVLNRGFYQYVGTSGGRAVPLSAGINVVAIVLGVIFLSFFLSEVLTFLPERGQVGFCNFAWAPK